MANSLTYLLFLLSFDQGHTQCSQGPLALTVGYETLEIKSPGYNTNGYPPNSFCQWVVTSLIEDAAILYGVYNMTVNCAGDALNVYNDYLTYTLIPLFVLTGRPLGNSSSAERQITNECTSGLIKKSIPTKTAGSGQLFITFQSDGDKSSNEWGFKMLMISGKTHGVCGNETLEANETTQYITSPKFPGVYDKDIDCEYHINPENTYANISLKLHFMDVEWADSCKYDYLQINQEKICGNEVWQPQRNFVDNIFVISFYSDNYSSANRGFILSFMQLTVNGSWSSWYNSTCTVSCGGGVLNRTRRCDSPPPTSDGASCVGGDFDTVACNDQPCPVDGSWGDWGNFSECSVSCGGGSMNRTRRCDNPPPQHGGIICKGSDNEIATCNDFICPVDGSWGPWSNFTDCSVSCGGGTMNRTRICDSPPPQHGGLSCPDDDSEKVSCNTLACFNNFWTEWSSWTECVNVCVKGLKKSKRDCLNGNTREVGQSCNGTSEKVDICNVDGGKTCRQQSFYRGLVLVAAAGALVGATCCFLIVLVRKTRRSRKRKKPSTVIPLA